MKRQRRSVCPIAFSLDLFGDRWSLLVLRDMVFGKRRHFHEFLESGEGIATNVLADRLNRLERAGVVEKTPDPADRRRRIYTLTEAGLDLVPVLLELVVWGARHDPATPVTEDFLRRVREDREAVVRDFRQRLSARVPVRPSDTVAPE